MRAITWLLALIAVVIIVYGAGAIQCTFQDSQQATGNTFTAFTSTLWIQTTQGDFQSDTLSKTDVTSSPGNVVLAINPTTTRYYDTGSISTQVIDTGRAGTKIDLLEWNASANGKTDITLNLRASDYLFASNNTTLGWISSSSPPIQAGQPTGRYIQWRADMKASNGNKNTPTLYDVTVWYH